MENSTLNCTSQNCMSPANGSYSNFHPRFTQLGWFVGIVGTHSILALIIVFSNFVALFAFYKNCRLRTTTNMVIVSMAVADLLVGAIVIPLWLYTGNYHFMAGPPFKIWQTRLSLAYQYIDQGLGFNSVYQLVLLHWLRSYSIWSPLQHRQMYNRTVILMCLLVWCISIAIPPLFHKVILPKSCADCFVYFTLIANIGVALVLLTIANIILLRSVAKSSRARQTKDTKVLVTVAMLIAVLCICFLPFIITNAVVRIRKIEEFNFNVRMALKFLHFCNSALNPLVYALRHPEIARTFKSLLYARSTRDLGVSRRAQGGTGITTLQAMSAIT